MPGYEQEVHAGKAYVLFCCMQKKYCVWLRVKDTEISTAQWAMWVGERVSELCLMPHPTQYRSFRRRWVGENFTIFTLRPTHSLITSSFANRELGYVERKTVWLWKTFTGGNKSWRSLLQPANWSLQSQIFEWVITAGRYDMIQRLHSKTDRTCQFSLAHKN